MLVPADPWGRTIRASPTPAPPKCTSIAPLDDIWDILKGSCGGAGIPDCLLVPSGPYLEVVAGAGLFAQS